MTSANQPDDGAYLPSKQQIARMAAELRRRHLAKMQKRGAPQLSKREPRTVHYGARRRMKGGRDT